ncbi:transposable element Tc3 transposase [Trichonephila clavipes]|nr:transposable element Tc3 transposase [Trichonephila clavipes]
MGSQVVRASDSRSEGLGSMPPNTLQVNTEYMLVKSVGPRSCGLSHERRDCRIFPSPSVQCRNCGGGDSDEAHFWLNGYVNKQNCRIWSEDNPQVYIETPLHPEKLTVWCALWTGGILLQKR